MRKGIHVLSFPCVTSTTIWTHFRSNFVSGVYTERQDVKLNFVRTVHLTRACHDTQIALTACYLSKLDRTKYNLVSISCFYATRPLINTFTKAQKWTQPSPPIYCWLDYTSVTNMLSEAISQGSHRSSAASSTHRLYLAATGIKFQKPKATIL
jgi:transposase